MRNRRRRCDRFIRIHGDSVFEKEPFYGQLRFVLEKRSGEEGDRLAAVCWHGLYCSDATPEEEKTTEYFSFDAEGLAKAQEWLNTQIE